MTRPRALTFDALLTELTARGILWQPNADGTLRLQRPAGAEVDDLKAAIGVHRQRLLEYHGYRVAAERCRAWLADGTLTRIGDGGFPLGVAPNSDRGFWLQPPHTSVRPGGLAPTTELELSDWSRPLSSMHHRAGYWLSIIAARVAEYLALEAEAARVEPVEVAR